MAHSTLPVLTHPAFPQVFTPALNAEVTRVSSRPVLSLCCHETVIWDGGSGEFDRILPCSDPAVIHDLASEMDYCAKHYREVGRG